MSIKRPTVREALLARKGGGDAHRREAIEDNFFRRLCLPGGVTKRTRRGRLADLDALVAEHLPCGRRLELMDVAVSSGVTTLDWAASLRRAGFDFGLVAGDATPAAWLLSLGRRVEVLVDGAGRPLQYDLYGLAMRSAAPGPLAMLPWLGRLLTRFALAWDGDPPALAGRRPRGAGEEARCAASAWRWWCRSCWPTRRSSWSKTTSSPGPPTLSPAARRGSCREPTKSRLLRRRRPAPHAGAARGTAETGEPPRRLPHRGGRLKPRHGLPGGGRG